MPVPVQRKLEILIFSKRRCKSCFGDRVFIERCVMIPSAEVEG